MEIVEYKGKRYTRIPAQEDLSCRGCSFFLMPPADSPACDVEYCLSSDTIYVEIKDE